MSDHDSDDAGQAVSGYPGRCHGVKVEDNYGKPWRTSGATSRPAGPFGNLQISASNTEFGAKMSVHGTKFGQGE